MKFIKWIVSLLVVTVLVACGGQQQASTSSQSSTAQSSQSSVAQSSQSATSETAITDLKQLKNTEHFLPNALAHIFEGEINRNGKAVGYHYEGWAHRKGEVIESTRTKPDKNGVYRARIKVEGVEKQAQSTFFPINMTPQQVVDLINEAYNKRTHQSGNIYEAKTESGITVQMYLTADNKIISAFPLYER